jgi:trimethylamine--corrinoid protein Co-methyltransferase
MDKIHQTAMRIIQDLGVVFMDNEAQEILRHNGADIDSKGTVRLDPENLMHWINKCPSTFQLYARNPERNVIIGGNNIQLAPVGGPPNISDLDKGRRAGTFEDQCTLIKLGQKLNVLTLSGAAPVEAMDLPAETRHLDFYHAQITLTDRVWNARAIGTERVVDALEMVAIARGINRQQLKHEPSLLSVVNVNSPRIMDSEMLRGLMEMVRNGQPCIVTPFTLAGAMSPITLAGSLAQQTAEALLVIAFTQMINPGCPVVFGGFTSNVDMKSGAPAFGTPEYAQAILIGGQLARRYGLPYRSSNVNASNSVDAQATYETMMSLWAAFMAHANIINHATGWLEGGLTASLEKYILDTEILQNLKQLLIPPKVDEDSLAFDAIRAIPPGGHHLGSEHTMARFKTAFYTPILSNWQNFESWQEDGATSATQRANGVWKALLEEYRPPPLDPAIAQRLDEYMARRKAQII